MTAPQADLALADLTVCEQIIERGLGTFVEVGQALVRIRNGRLYRADFPTFETYCESRWSMSRRRAYQLIEAADVCTVVHTENEAQARELAPLRDQPEAMKAAYEKASEATGGKPTAAAIRNVVRPVTKVTETTKTETYVDTTTGEVLDRASTATDAPVLTPAQWASTPTEREVVEPTNAELHKQLLDSLPADDQFRSNLVRACAPNFSVLNLPPARVVETYLPGSDAALSLDSFIRSMTGWLDQVQAGIKRSHLRSVR